jgi:integrase
VSTTSVEPIAPELDASTEPTKRSTRRRGNGEGSIYQSEKDGRWIAMLSIGYDGNGKRQRKAIYGQTKKEVLEELAKLQNAKIDGVLCAPSKLTVAKLLERWLETRSKIADTTRANYKNAIERHINKRIGGLGLQKLTPLHVQSLYTDLQQSAGTDVCRISHVVLSRALKQAVRWGMVPRNVCDAVERPKTVKADIQPLNAEQAGSLLDAASGDRLEALYVVAVDTGMRLGKLFGLQWSDVDFEHRTISVRHTLQELSGKLKLKPPKTANSRRKIDLAQMSVDALSSHKKAMLIEGHGRCEFVFCNLHGTPLRRSHFHRQDFKPLLKAAGLPDMHFHSLRHTSATLQLMGGVHPKVVQERHGHSQISVTMDTYSHVLDGMGRDAADKLNSIFSSVTKPRAAVAGA